MTEVIIGSRESKLAVLQSEMVKSYIEQKNREENAGSEITVNILTMKTTGDIILDRTLDKAVSYTHLDVYKRQIWGFLIWKG